MEAGDGCSGSKNSESRVQKALESEGIVHASQPRFEAEFRHSVSMFQLRGRCGNGFMVSAICQLMIHLAGIRTGILFWNDVPHFVSLGREIIGVVFVWRWQNWDLVNNVEVKASQVKRRRFLGVVGQ
jgi:hypothetical protein